MQHLISRLNIESSQAFQRLLDKTQVLSQKQGMENVIRNRLTHSYEVATAAKIIAKSVSNDKFNADYKETLFNVCLMHDIGHAPFGHAGGTVLDKKFKAAGLTEGFSDNNNNLVILEVNKIEVSDYETASLIKYPDKLYSSQQHYKAILAKAIQEDIEHFKEFININETPQRTLACEIMDEADQNTYICSDLQDSYNMKLDNSESLNALLNNGSFSNKEIIQVLKEVIKAVEACDKILLRSSLNKIRLLINQNYYLADNLKLVPKDLEIIRFKDALKEITDKEYIFGDYSTKKERKNSLLLNVFIDCILDQNLIFSEFYKEKITSAKNETEKLTFIRDMIAELTDNFVRKYFSNE
ncbi:MAG: HD domain-containing protein [Proteobacteria bacterium]|nr:HD domain-containing protein [Pseudomonadota bacterium]